jgi:hypothetical protein
MRVKPEFCLFIIGALALATHARTQSTNLAPLKAGATAIVLVLDDEACRVPLPAGVVYPYPPESLA